MATIQEQMKANSEKWWTASPTEKKQLEAANQSLGKQTNLSYNSSSGTWNNPSGTQAYTVNSGSGGGSSSSSSGSSGSSGTTRNTVSPNPSTYPSYLNGVTGNKGGTWQERLQYFYNNPGEVAGEITRAGGVNTPEANDWIGKLSQIIPGASQFNQNPIVQPQQTVIPQQPNIVQQPPAQLPQNPVQPQQPPRNINDVTSQLQNMLGKYNFPYEQMLRDLTAQPSAYKPPSEQDMLAQSKQYAGLQVDPILSAISSRLAGARTSATNAKTATEAAYAGVPAQAQARLDEARRYALEDAISRNMGRSGVVNWSTAKLSAPILQQVTASEQEKAAKLSAIANELANAEAETGRLTQETETRRGTLESYRLNELQQLAQQMAAQEQQQKFNQGQTLSNYGQQANLAQQQLLAQLIPLFMNG